MEFKEGDKVYFHRKPGAICQTTILHIYREWADLEDVNDWMYLGDLYGTEESAEESLSPDAKRLSGCYREATLLCGMDSVVPFELDSNRQHSLISTLAHMLFDRGNRK